MAMNWQKVTQAMIDKAGEYQDKADGNKNLNPGLSNYYQSRAVELREQASFFLAGLEGLNAKALKGLLLEAETIIDHEAMGTPLWCEIVDEWKANLEVLIS